ncbi:hypothetical protein [Brevundimonas sp. Root1423]|uniref:hypothetical protein n=1 Tax=Brevundimonas sp. Root1423 TaxID=1736462 RepID=UPI00071449D0|nr:hypothetical protein [Brevundimonas sp. Root1423]KQY84590.1 hypothetical protein ASD25_05960 [Brevundimonas sp. Root1423]
MSLPEFHELYPNSPAFRDMQPLRIPAGWLIGWNQLDVGMASDLSGVGGSSVFHATNEGRRFNIDVEFRPEFDPEGSFHLTVLYQPWPRTGRGHRRQDVPFAFGIDAETVHTFETRSYAALIAELEHWIARCSIWQREGR